LARDGAGDGEHAAEHGNREQEKMRAIEGRLRVFAELNLV